MLAARQSASALRDSLVMSVPLTTISPDVGRSMPAMALSSVLLPEPLAPISDTKSPRSISRFTSLSGVMTSSPLRNCLVSLRISTSAMWLLSLLLVLVSSAGRRCGRYRDGGCQLALAECSIFARDANPLAVRQALAAGDDQLVGAESPCVTSTSCSVPALPSCTAWRRATPRGRIGHPDASSLLRRFPPARAAPAVAADLAHLPTCSPGCSGARKVTCTSISGLMTAGGSSIAP